MDQPHILGTAQNYTQYLKLVRARVAELGITHETLDAVAGLQSGYASKILCDPPMKNMGPFTMFMVMEALGMQVALLHDGEAYDRVKSRLVRRLRPRQLNGAKHTAITISLGPDFLRQIGRKGGRNRGKVLSRRQLKRIAKMGARARWAKVNAAAS